jgi:phosphoadenosine phosphosulfate reductase
MVKKRLASGETCRKCREAEAQLQQRGLWGRVDEVVWAQEGDDSSPGMLLARQHGVAEAPFFVVTAGGHSEVYTSVLRLVRALGRACPATAVEATPEGVAALTRELGGAEPAELVRAGLERFGGDCAIAFSGAEDVLLVALAVETGLPCSVFTLDTGRLHPETYEYLDKVRSRWGLELEVMTPDPALLEPFVRQKGLFSFYRDGHQECCGIRKVEPLKRALATRRAWMTGQRRDQSPGTRAELGVVELDSHFRGAGGAPLIKLNPLARQTSTEVWRAIQERELPYNPLHERGFASIGCAPCTRPTHPGQHEREGRWWWEEATQKECGLHLAKEPKE